MGLHTRAQFAVLCGLKKDTSRAYIATNISRGKIIEKDGYIDDLDQSNAFFLEKEIRKNRSNQTNNQHSEKIIGLIKPDAGNENLISDYDYDGTDSNIGETLTELTKKKLVVEIAKKEREIALLKLREDKLNAIVIPTELVKVIFSQHSKSIATEFKNSIDGIITKISKKKDLNINEIAELRGELLATVNISIEKSLIESKRNIENIVSAYAEKREVGEHG